jgi:hypothetical protein
MPKSKMYLKEKKEHPSFTNKQITQIVKDHKRKTRGVKKQWEY